jgi:hypothetical protein
MTNNRKEMGKMERVSTQMKGRMISMMMKMRMMRKRMTKTEFLKLMMLSLMMSLRTKLC